MKRKTLALLLCAVLLLTACTAPPPETTAPPTTQPVETTAPVAATTAPPETTAPVAATTSGSVCEVGSATVTAGNLILPIPDGYTATLVNENAIMLGSPDGKCGISIFAADISDLDEAAVMLYLPMQRESFYQDDVVRTEPESIGRYAVGGFDVDMLYYGEMATDLSTQSTLDTTFTDSWYCYTILLRTAEKETTDYVKAYGKMVLESSYTGISPRFDFVQ